MGFSIYPDTKMDEHRMVAILQRRGLDRVLVNSAADWGRSDPLKTAKTGAAMLDAGFSADDASAGSDATATFEGNSILRGSRD
jgi:predicted metal-dependent TIM-barrel fold hydrolase